MRTLNTDLVVVGGGLAGLTAAIRGSHLGLSTAVLEKGVEAAGWSNTRMSGARYHATGISPLADARRIAERAQIETAGTSSKRLTEAWSANCRRSFEFLRTLGIRFITLRGVPVMAPVRPNRKGEVWRGYGADVAVRRMISHLEASGGQHEPGIAVRSLICKGRTVAGVEAERIDTGERLAIKARAVVLADGGFQSNEDLLRTIAKVRAPKQLIQRGAKTGTGDGLAMAVAANAATVGGDGLYGHLVHRDAFSNRDLAHYPMLDALATAAVLVDATGLRFTDEGQGGIASANQIARLEDPASTWLVFDQDIWRTAGRTNQIVPPNPNLLLARARVESAWTIENLAVKAGLPSDALRETLSDLVSADPLVPRRGTRPTLTPPYFAVPVAVGITFTMGGIAIDEYARVINSDGDPIVGLYAAGTTAGGLSGGPKPGYIGGLSVAGVFGLLAAEHAAQSLKEHFGAVG